MKKKGAGSFWWDFQEGSLKYVDIWEGRERADFTEMDISSLALSFLPAWNTDSILETKQPSHNPKGEKHMPGVA